MAFVITFLVGNDQTESIHTTNEFKHWCKVLAFGLAVVALIWEMDESEDGLLRMR
jgi:hypothetical protein